MGVFLGYAAPRGHVLLDRRLFLPRAWADDEDRRQAAKVPKEVAFETKPQQALAMLQHAWALGVPMRWVAGDEVYGDSPEFRSGVEAAGHGYVLAVASTTPVWTRRPRTQPPTPQPMGRPCKKARLAGGGAARQGRGPSGEAVARRALGAPGRGRRGKGAAGV